MPTIDALFFCEEAVYDPQIGDYRFSRLFNGIDTPGVPVILERMFIVALTTGFEKRTPLALAVQHQDPSLRSAKPPGAAMRVGSSDPLGFGIVVVNLDGTRLDQAGAYSFVVSSADGSATATATFTVCMDRGLKHGVAATDDPG